MDCDGLFECFIRTVMVFLNAFNLFISNFPRTVMVFLNAFNLFISDFLRTVGVVCALRWHCVCVGRVGCEATHHLHQ